MITSEQLIKLRKGDKVNYSFFSNVEFIKLNSFKGKAISTVTLRDHSKTFKYVYVGLFLKHGEVINPKRAVTIMGEEDADLKECPFCGGKAKLELIGNDFTKKRSSQITCTKCHIKMVVGAIKQSHQWTIEKITEQWNNRSV